MQALRLSEVGSVVMLAAHPDDIEIGAGGLLLRLTKSHPGLRVQYVLLSGTPERKAEARGAAAAFLSGADISFVLHDFPDGHLPGHWDDVKSAIQGVAALTTPDLVLAPWHGDAHQDHRTISAIVPTAFRDSLVLQYEIPKWDGDLGRPSVYVPLDSETAKRKVELLQTHFPSQHGHDWWDDEVFLGIARLRGMECRATYAEAFHCDKLAIELGA